MAEVSVDVETGVVRVDKMVAVQDCGLVINMTTAESQVYGALILGINYSLYEEKIMDEQTGKFESEYGVLQAGRHERHWGTGRSHDDRAGYDERGVIGLGEPPVISPGAAISNAVANAIGVRVPTIPLTPRQVLAALEGRQA